MATTPTLVTQLTTQVKVNGMTDYSQLAGVSRMILADKTETTSGNSGVLAVPAGARQVEMLIDVIGTVSGTSPSLTVSYNVVMVDTSNPLAPMQLDTITSYSATALTAAGTASIAESNVLIGDYATISWTITGTSPSFGGVYIKVIWKK